MSKLNWKKVIGWGVAALVVIGVVGTNMYNQQEQRKDSVKPIVYALLPLSGPIANTGQEFKKAAELYVKEHPNLPYQFEFVDGQFNPTYSLSAIRSKVLDRKNPIVVMLSATAASAVVPFIDSVGGFVLITSVKSDALNNYHNFQTISIASGKGMKLVAEYVSKKYKKIAMFYANSDFGVINHRYFKTNLSPEVQLNDEIFDTTNPDIRTQVLKVLAKKPEAIVISGPAVPAFINLFRELKIQGFKGEIIGDITFNQPVVLETLAEGADGITFLGLDCFLDQPMTPEGKKFKEFFRKNGIVASTAHAEGYNSALLLDKVLTEKKQMSQQMFLDMKQMLGSSGPIYFNEPGESTFSFILTKLKDGKIVPVTE